MTRVFLTRHSVWVRYWTDVRHVFVTKGIVRGLRFMISRARWDDFIHLNQSCRVLTQLVTESPITKEPKIPITFRLATEDDFPLYIQIHHWPSFSESHAQMLSQGDMTMLAFDGDKLIGQQSASIWRRNKKPYDPDLPALARHYPLNYEEDAYLHGWIVREEYRRHRVAAPLAQHLMKALYEAGVRRIYTTVPDENIPSLWACYSIGQEVIGEMYARQVTSWHWITVHDLNHNAT